ncbi:MAG: argininosuccinate synthase [Planctomycetes bacterium]|nr:argininosuccinate synthase [Planctomycetota bacterium]
MRIVLAFSGGLDTSFCVPWLRERGHEVITVFVDTGGVTSAKRREIASRAKALGALRHYARPAEQAIWRQILVPLIRANAAYQQAYPLMCADRYVIAQECAEVARRERAKAIAHGSTGMGNDQVRFDIAIRALGDFDVVAPIRDFQQEVRTNLRQREIDYLAERGFSTPAAHRRYSINQNVFGVTISGSEIDRNAAPAEDAFVLTRPVHRAPAKSEQIRIGFEGGTPAMLFGSRADGIAILKHLNERVGRHGAGRFIYTGDCVIGIKGRIAFECPGLYACLVAHRALEDATLSKEQNQFKVQVAEKWAYLNYSGLFHDPLTRDLEAFLESHQRSVTGEVTLEVGRGVVLPVAIDSPNLLRDRSSVYAQSSAWEPAEAAAFVKLFGMSTVLANRRERGRG